MKRNLAPETKVAGGGTVGAVIWLVFELAATYHWFTPPSPAITAAIVTFASTAVAYVLPHTHLRPDPKPSQRALFDMAEALGAEVRMPLTNAILTAGPTNSKLLPPERPATPPGGTP